ncbi:uncharacterized protein LTR77_001426 [Saxophila tyrrhenica]|uniref:F-box domain-containing protein n=1 Tax=Saxophila tyrrhenica TaxID=1690608 RepID=A0AAV9PKT8_9PEZI|nr:hypothetical protein LTR77_001426 [Saxophila tyrrhenica]
MPSSFESCPPETVGNIVQNLSFEDIGNLRLSSRTMAALSTQEKFESFFSSKETKLSPTDLNYFVRMTGESSLACLVQELTISGIADDTTLLERMLKEKDRRDPKTQRFVRLTEEELAKTKRDLDTINAQRDERVSMRESGKDVELLTKAFRNVLAGGKQARRLALTMNVVLRTEDAETFQSPVESKNRDAIWQAAADCFGCVMGSLKDSKLPVQALNVFYTTMRCSLDLSLINKLRGPAEKYADVLKVVKSLRISLSEWPRGRSEPVQTDSLHDAASDESPGIAGLLKQCPVLRTLEVHWYDTDTDLPHLNGVTLRGLYLSESSCLNFLQSVASVSDLTMVEIKLSEGSFTPIFAYCASEKAGIDRVYFEDFWERELVWFDDGREPKVAVWGAPKGGQTLERSGAEARQPIQYHLGDQYERLASPEEYRWNEDRCREYGP